MEALHAHANILSLFPSVSKRFGTLTKHDVPRVPKIKAPKLCSHDYAWNGVFWRCRVCLRSSQKPLNKLVSINELRCPGASQVLGEVFATLPETLHSIRVCYTIPHGASLCFCSRCGCFAESRPKGLKKGCEGKAPRYSTGDSNLRKLGCGKHPRLRGVRVGPSAPALGPTSSELEAAVFYQGSEQDRQLRSNRTGRCWPLVPSDSD
jgi:hypothetical protein